VDYFYEIREQTPLLTKETVKRFMFNQLKEMGLPQQWLVPSYKILREKYTAWH
jgi:hypothetical protein